MSTDYQLFFQTTDSAQSTLEIISGIDGIEIQDGLKIAGLVEVSCVELDADYREIMSVEYGKHGLDINWSIFGTYDKKSDINELTDRLLACAMALIKARPNQPLSIMRNGESFYLFYDTSQLILSPIFRHSEFLNTTVSSQEYSIQHIDY